jgi:hypothetical protein
VGAASCASSRACETVSPDTDTKAIRFHALPDHFWSMAALTPPLQAPIAGRIIMHAWPAPESRAEAAKSVHRRTPPVSSACAHLSPAPRSLASR